MTDDPKKVIEGEVLSAQELQSQLTQLESELTLNDPKFRQFMELRNQVNDKYAEVRKKVEDVMVQAYQEGRVDKSIKGDWGSITVTESDRFEIDEAELPAEFFKKVVDESKIRATYQLEGEAPKGAKQFKRYGVMMRLK